MTISEAMAYIQGYQKSGKPVHDLSRIQALLDAIGNPQEQLQVIHIAGDKRQRLCDGFLCGGSHRSRISNRYADVAVYPALHRPHPDRRAGYSRRGALPVLRTGESLPVSADCSQFEITFAIALLWFLEQHCDLVVLETGIGGLLDATNVVKKPLVCAITSVSFDHMALLGNTLTEIAAQKAGIIKQGCPVVLSTDNPMDVVCLVQETAKQKNAQLVIPNMQDCRILSETLEETVFQYHSFTYTLHMPGRH